VRRAAAFLSSALLSMGCRHEPTQADRLYQALDNYGMTPYSSPLCFESGETIGPDERTFLGVSGTEAALRVTGDHAVGVRWSAGLSGRPHVDALLQTVSEIDVHLELLPDTPIEAVPRVSRLGREYCAFPRGYLRFPVTVTVAAPGLFTVTGVEPVYVGSVDPSDPDAWRFGTSAAPPPPLVGSPSPELLAALQADDVALSPDDQLPAQLFGPYLWLHLGGGHRIVGDLTGL
jgi:hypothetical protein